MSPTPEEAIAGEKVPGTTRLRVVFQLLAPPAAGKLTVAREIVARLGPGTVLLDNHRISSPILAVVGADGVAPVPREAWSYARRIKEIVMEAAETLSPVGSSFVFTNYLTEGPSAEESFRRTVRFAERRQAVLVPVALDCHPEELVRRIDNEDRRARSKLVDARLLRELLERKVFVPDHPNLIRLPSDQESPGALAERVLGHAYQCTRRGP